jgi:hypothetical protein
MAMTAEDILEQVRALPAPERLRLVERIVREVADQTPLSPPPTEATPAAQLPDAIWADVPDDEWDAFTARLRAFREESWRRIA